MSVAAVAAGGLLGSALAMQGPTKISLSSESHHRHQMMGSSPSTMGGMSSPMRTSMGGGMGGGMAMPGYHKHWQGMMGRQMMNGQAFITLDNNMDPTFNQLLGVNNRGQIAGYFGSGEQGHPNKGYLVFVSRHRAAFLNENVPGSLQTQVTGLNDNGVTVGFWSTQNTANGMNNNFGFYTWHGRFHNVSFPTPHPANPPVNQLLGVNNRGVAVGFFTDSQGNNHGYIYNIFAHRYSRVLMPRLLRGRKAPSLTAAAINNRGDVAGFYDAPGGMTDAFLKLAHGTFIRLAYPGATMTQAFGVNDRDEVVGAYTVGSGNMAKTYGFTWTPRYGFRSVSDPLGMGATTVNGVNDLGDLVGFYTDQAGNTHGMIVLPGHGRMPMPMPTQSAMPTMSPATGMTSPPMMTPSGMPSASTSQPMAPAQATTAPPNGGSHY